MTAVIVAHDGARWLPRALAALGAQQRPIERLIAVDAGSEDASYKLLADFAAAHQEMAPHVSIGRRALGFGAAVRHGLETAAATPVSTDAVQWLWLLHDDSAPEPDALAELLALADDMPSAAVIGPKIRGWDDRRVLLEAGVTVDHGGRRETGLERGEFDQGQHDSVRDVMAVSTAGMLVRRDVWEALGGLDPALPLFRDDLDFCWRAHRAGHRVVVCPNAVVYHVEAAASRKRPLSTEIASPRRADRLAALYTLLVNGATVWLPVTMVRLLVGSLLRSLALLVAKRPEDAWDEILAVAGIARRLRLIVDGRRARNATGKASGVPSREMRQFFAPLGTRARHYAEAARDRLSGKHVDSVDAARQSHAIETGPSADHDAEPLEVESAGLLRTAITRPPVVLAFVLLLITLVAERRLLHGGVLFGGSLLPAPTGASDLWRLYGESWHATGFGSAAATPPYIAVVATVATLLFGHAPLAVEILLLLSVPLAGISAYVASKPISSSAHLRVWAAAAYALLPVATGAIAGGRLGTAVAFALLPLLLRVLVGALVTSPKSVGLRRAWGAALLLALVSAFEPVTWVLLVPLVLATGLVGAFRRDLRAVLSAVVVPVASFALLLPWSWHVVRHPAVLLVGQGLPQSGSVDPIDVLLLRPGGPGLPPLWVGAALLVVGLAGLLRTERRGLAGLGWALAFAGFAGGMVVAALSTSFTGVPGELRGWPGIATAIAGAGLLVAGLVAGTGMRGRLTRMSFGWRQPLALIVAIAAGIAPLTAAAAWVVRGAEKPLHRESAEVLPAFIRVDKSGDVRPDAAPRSLVLNRASNGTMSYSLLREGAPTLGEADLPPSAERVRRYDAAVADLGAGGGFEAVTQLVRLGVRYVLATGADTTGLARTLDDAGGLARVTTRDGLVVWKVSDDIGRVGLVDPTSGSWQPVAFTGLGKPSEVSYNSSVRLLVLAESPSPRWRATVDGAPLERTTYYGEQAFVMPADGGTLLVTRTATLRTGWIIFGAAALVTVVLLATPAGRRS